MTQAEIDIINHGLCLLGQHLLAEHKRLDLENTDRVCEHYFRNRWLDYMILVADMSVDRYQMKKEVSHALNKP